MALFEGLLRWGSWRGEGNEGRGILTFLQKVRIVFKRNKRF